MIAILILTRLYEVGGKCYILKENKSSQVCAASRQKITHFNWQYLDEQHKLGERRSKQSLKPTLYLMIAKFQKWRWDTKLEFKTKNSNKNVLSSKTSYTSQILHISQESIPNKQLWFHLIGKQM